MGNLTHLLDVLDRSYEGPLCDEKEFDLQIVANTTTRIVKKYQISFDKSKIIQDDEDLIQRAWMGAIELLSNCGVFNRSTGRRIIFSEREIKDYLSWLPGEGTMGAGRDTRSIYARSISDPRPPRVIGGAIGVPMDEYMFVPIMESYIKEPLLDGVSTGILSTTNGREIRTGTPLEIIASWQDVDQIMPALRRYGRPGLQLGAINQSPTDIGFLSAVNSLGYRSTDRHSIAMISELKTDNKLLNKVVHSIRHDGSILGIYNPIYGGLGGGEEGVAVLMIAGLIAAQITYMATNLSSCPTHPSLYCDTTQEILRLSSVAISAISRHSRMMMMMMTSPAGGPGTDVVLYECLAIATMATVCGSAQLLGVRSATGIVPNHCSGLEARFNAEVGRAASGVQRLKADEIVKKALAKYQDILSTKPIGKPFTEVYDLQRIQPKKEWQATYDLVKEEATSWGLMF